MFIKSGLLASMAVAFIACNLLAATGAAAQDAVKNTNAGEGNDPLMVMLRARVESDPNHSDSWRLLGKYQAKSGNALAAIESLSRALSLDPENAAAHYDMGRALQSIDDQPGASGHFDSCVKLAPQSQYAEELYAQGLADRPAKPSLAALQVPFVSPDAVDHSLAVDDGNPLPANGHDAAGMSVDTVGYRIQTFDGADDLEQRFDQLQSDADPTLKRMRVFIETGILYNSNVSLTPISRELANSQAKSFQGLLNPELEWIAIQRRAWRMGTLGRGFFTVNESSQSEFDLASFQPGGFVERDLSVGESEWIGRLEYVYAIDLFDGDRIGDRHSLTASLIMIRPDLDVIYTYLTTSYSQFDSPGTNPSVDSLDGPAISGGVSRFFQTGRTWAPTYSLGVDLQSTDTEGSDFRFRSISGHSDMTFQLRPKWQFVPSVGLGFRDYYAFTGPVDRDELTWRVQGKLRFQMTQRTAVALVAGHDRFASKNEDFDAERTQGGVIASLNY